MIKIRSSEPIFRRNHKPVSPEVLEILVHADGVLLDSSLIEAVKEKIGRVRKYAPQALRARVRLQKLNSISRSQQFRAQVVYELPGNDLAASQLSHDPLVAVDLLAEKIERRLRKRKTAVLASRLRWQRRRMAALARDTAERGI